MRILPRERQHIAVVDFECTCSARDEGDHTITQPHMEIIEIGAVMLRLENFEPVDEFCSFVRPVVHPQLTDYCVELTSITQPDVDHAAGFPDVYWRFKDWLWDWQAQGWGSWGAFDAYALQFDAQRHGLTDELALMPSHVNLKKWWTTQMGGKRIGLGRAVAAAGLEWAGRAHRGIDDARMVARLLPTIGWPEQPQGVAIRPGFED